MMMSQIKAMAASQVSRSRDWLTLSEDANALLCRETLDKKPIVLEETLGRERGKKVEREEPMQHLVMNDRAAHTINCLPSLLLLN